VVGAFTAEATVHELMPPTAHVYAFPEVATLQDSVFWMAPEMLHSNRQGYNAKVDIWSVGCVVLEMQAGLRPWSEEDMFGVMYKVRVEHFRWDNVLTIVS
jgi:serine/threonine protein kinase